MKQKKSSCVGFEPVYHEPVVFNQPLKEDVMSSLASYLAELSCEWPVWLRQARSPWHVPQPLRLQRVKRLRPSRFQATKSPCECGRTKIRPL